MPIILSIVLLVVSLALPIYQAILKIRRITKEDKAEREFEKQVEDTFKK